MSEIKYINLDDDRLWEILFDEACVEGGQAECIQKELEKIAIDEKEITRKPMQAIVERLEEQTRIDVFCINNSFTQKDKDQFWNKKKAHQEAIEIVKEVGGMNG